MHPPRRKPRQEEPAGGGFQLPEESWSSSGAGRVEREPEVPQETVSPEVKAQIDELRDARVSGIKHTTRGLPRTSFHLPEGPRPFSAGRFQVDFEKPDGSTIGMIFETEADVGHLHTFVPGETASPNAYAGFLEDPNDSYRVGQTLNKPETAYLISGLYAKFANAMTDSDAQALDQTISYAFGVWAKEGGQSGAVKSTHQQLTAQVQARQHDSQADADSNGGWHVLR
ncbi:MAG: hypothetical protein HY319_06170 [Armatimonadetes bacterium]|nr:hypothetical protein [Armatimonadota bacterium]